LRFLPNLSGIGIVRGLLKDLEKVNAMQSSQKHLGQSFGMFALLAATCAGIITMMSQVF
jgi:hypothetical protein